MPEIKQPTYHRRIISGLRFLLLIVPLACSSSMAFAQQAKDVVAIQLRAQGIPCTNPAKAINDVAMSSRDEKNWIISCNEATYRVKLIPHIGAKVEILDVSEPTADARR